jgi:Predicted phosphotransferase related to Ser/Thr protein kinases
VDQRLEKLTQWLQTDIGLSDFDIKPASSDASFRRYFRVFYNDQSAIAMDAPPEKEDSLPYVKVGRHFAAIGLNVPEILAEDLRQGFLLLSDLGSRLYLDALNDATVAPLYGDALEALTLLQARGAVGDSLPPYDRALLWQEMELFRAWYLKRHLKLSLKPQDHALLNRCFETLVCSALEQPRVCVHRDYHSRNLIATERNNPGILDFQDAVVGPFSYDLVSLLRDCYVAWPRDRVEAWALSHRDWAIRSGVLPVQDAKRFLRWFDLMGMQRHLKASGIFARLNYRDGKPDYLKDIPRTLGYVLEVSGRYAEFGQFHDFLESLEGRSADAGGTVS